MGCSLPSLTPTSHLLLLQTSSSWFLPLPSVQLDYLLPPSFPAQLFLTLGFRLIPHLEALLYVFMTPHSSRNRLEYMISSTSQPHLKKGAVPILQMMAVRLRGMKSLAQNHVTTWRLRQVMPTFFSPNTTPAL